VNYLNPFSIVFRRSGGRGDYLYRTVLGDEIMLIPFDVHSIEFFSTLDSACEMVVFPCVFEENTFWLIVMVSLTKG
jgi:hypothetical protein